MLDYYLDIYSFPKFAFMLHDLVPPETWQTDSTLLTTFNPRIDDVIKFSRIQMILMIIIILCIIDTLQTTVLREVCIAWPWPWSWHSGSGAHNLLTEPGHGWQTRWHRTSSWVECIASLWVSIITALSHSHDNISSSSHGQWNYRNLSIT